MKQFSHFQDGYKIENWQINDWLCTIRHRLIAGNSHSCISSGDCSVVGMRWPTEYEFIVCTSAGRSTMRFYMDEVDEMRNFIFDYHRPN